MANCESDADLIALPLRVRGLARSVQALDSDGTSGVTQKIVDKRHRARRYCGARDPGTSLRVKIEHCS